MDFYTIFKDAGTPVGVVVVVFLMLYHFGKWLGPKVILPLRDGHLKYLKATIAINKRNAATNERNALALQSLADGQRDIVEHLTGPGVCRYPSGGDDCRTVRPPDSVSMVGIGTNSVRQTQHPRKSE